MSIFITSDHHFYHKNIIEYEKRPFNTVDEMNKAMIEKWNSVVKVNDEVYHLGDFALQSNTEEMRKLIKNLNGIIHLILGNHDWTKPFRYIRSGIESVHTSLYLDEFFLIHDPHNQKQIFYPLKQGKHILHGHMHSKKMNDDRFTNMSVEHWDYTPVEINDLRVWVVK